MSFFLTYLKINFLPRVQVFAFHTTIIDIPESCVAETAENQQIGNGRFGICTVVKFHEYYACMKKLDKTCPSTITRSLLYEGSR